MIKILRRALILVFTIGMISAIHAAQLFHCKVNQWKDNKYDGLWIAWSDSMKKNVESRGHYKKGKETGVWRYYFDDGTLRRKERYSAKGISTKYFYPNGKIKSKGKAILDDEEDFLHYYYQGDWIYYSEDGKPEQVITYERGVETANKKIGRLNNH